MPRSVDYHDHLIRSLRNPREARAYLNAALEEGDIQMFLKALRNVAEARGVKRGSKGGEKPSIQSIDALLSSLGFRLAVERRDAA